MRLRAKIIAYLVLIHAVLEAISFLVLRENRLWLLAVEGLFVLSIVFSTKRNGRGLGLTLVQEILSQHGFEFSLAPGEEGGAEFRVAF